MATASATGASVSDEEAGTGSPGSRKSPSQGSVEDPDSLDLGGHHPTRDALAEGIVSLLSPTLRTLDVGVLETKRSQEELSEQIALLTEQLKLIAAEQSCPIDLDGYVNRLGTIKGKINIISSVLHTAQERLNKVHDQAVKEAARRKPLVEASPVTSPGAYADTAAATASSAVSKSGAAEKSDEEDENDTNQNPSQDKQGFKDPLSDSASS